MTLHSITQAIDAYRRGEIVVVVDDEDRENEGDLLLAAEFATTQKLAFFVRHTSGYICTAVTEQRAEDLEIPLMVSINRDRERTAFAVSVDAAVGTTTGISAGDRARTARLLADPGARAVDFHRPGHMQVLHARPGGVLQRAGHTEAAVDLAQLAGLQPVALLCEIVTADGADMARGPELEAFASTHGLVMVSIADLVRYRRDAETHVRAIAEGRIPTPWGEFTSYAFESDLDGSSHLAFVLGNVSGDQDVLVRVHSECLTGDVFSSLRCDCGAQLERAMELIGEEGRGVVVYMRGHEGRGIGIAQKLHAYELQDRGRDTVEANLDLGYPADSREYGIGAEILVALGVRRIRLLTNNPSKRGGLDGYGLTISAVVPIEITATSENLRYLRAKRDRMGHQLTDLGPDLDLLH